MALSQKESITRSDIVREDQDDNFKEKIKD